MTVDYKRITGKESYMLFDVIFEFLSAWLAGTSKDEDEGGSCAVFFFYFTLGFVLLAAVVIAPLMYRFSLDRYVPFIVYCSLAIWGLVGLGCFTRAWIRKRMRQVFGVLCIFVVAGLLVFILGLGT